MNGYVIELNQTGVYTTEVIYCFTMHAVIINMMTDANFIFVQVIPQLAVSKSNNTSLSSIIHSKFCEVLEKIHLKKSKLISDKNVYPVIVSDIMLFHIVHILYLLIQNYAHFSI